MDVAVTIGSTDEDDGVHVEISDDTAYTPELASDLLHPTSDGE